jgi:hypothetical protein
LDIGGKRTAICVIDESGKAIWRGTVDTHPEMIDGALPRFKGLLDKVGLESGPFTPHLFRSLEEIGYPMICMNGRRAADAIKSRRIKSDKGDPGRWRRCCAQAMRQVPVGGERRRGRQARRAQGPGRRKRRRRSHLAERQKGVRDTPMLAGAATERGRLNKVR